jgi:hypothetical protein
MSESMTDTLTKIFHDRTWRKFGSSVEMQTADADTEQLETERAARKTEAGIRRLAEEAKRKQKKPLNVQGFVQRWLISLRTFVLRPLAAVGHFFGNVYGKIFGGRSRVYEEKFGKNRLGKAKLRSMLIRATGRPIIVYGFLTFLTTFPIAAVASTLACFAFIFVDWTYSWVFRAKGGEKKTLKYCAAETLYNVLMPPTAVVAAYTWTCVTMFYALGFTDSSTSKLAAFALFASVVISSLISAPFMVLAIPTGIIWTAICGVRCCARQVADALGRAWASVWASVWISVWTSVWARVSAWATHRAHRWTNNYGSSNGAMVPV